VSEKDWAAFVTIVEEGNISKAAEKLFLSQPALSYRIKQIEDDIKTHLFLRTNGGIMLTPQGEIYYDYCRRMMNERELLKEQMGNLTGEIQGTLKIASSINFADYELPVLLNTFTQMYPRVRIQVKTGYSYQVSKLFNMGDYMLAFARGSYKGAGSAIKLLEEPYCLVYHRKVSYEELPNLPLIRYTSDPTINLSIESWCSDHLPTTPIPSMELDSMATCRHFVREGLGWAILPYMGLGSCKEGNIYVEPLTLKNGEKLTRSTSLFYDENSLNLKAVRTFVDYVHQYYENRNYTNIGEKPDISQFVSAQ